MIKSNQLQLCSSVWKLSSPHSKTGMGRCQLDEWEQTANESKLHRLDAQSCYMSTNQHQTLKLCCCDKEIQHFCPLFHTVHQKNAIYDQSLFFCTCSSDSPIQLWLEKAGDDAHYHGWRSFLYSLRFLTDAIIHYASGRLVHVKYRAQAALNFDFAGGPSELWLRKCFVRVCVFNF